VKDGHLIVDGAVLSEPYTVGQATDRLLNSAVIFPVQVPAGYVWVMGDNRTASQDSRWFGPIAVSAILGKVAGVQ
jgi:signal peptidase I